MFEGGLLRVRPEVVRMLAATVRRATRLLDQLEREQFRPDAVTIATHRTVFQQLRREVATLRERGASRRSAGVLDAIDACLERLAALERKPTKPIAIIGVETNVV